MFLGIATILDAKFIPTANSNKCQIPLLEELARQNRHKKSSQKSWILKEVSFCVITRSTSSRESDVAIPA